MTERTKRPKLNFAELVQTPILTVIQHYGIVLKASKSGNAMHGDCPLPQHLGDRKGTFGVNLRDNYCQCFSTKCQEARGGRKIVNPICLVQYEEKLPDYYSAAARLQAILHPGIQSQPVEEKAEVEVVKAAPEEVKTLRPMQVLEIELLQILQFPKKEDQSFGEWREEVVKELKAKFRLNYLAGVKDGFEKARKEEGDGLSSKTS